MPALIGLQPKTYRHASRRLDDAAIRERLRELALEWRQFRYRRLHLLLLRPPACCAKLMPGTSRVGIVRAIRRGSMFSPNSQVPIAC
jgi:hypothetical protein